MYSLSQIEEACKVVGVTKFQFELLEKVLRKLDWRPETPKEIQDWGVAMSNRLLGKDFNPSNPLVHVDPLPNHIKPLDHNCPVCRDPLYARKVDKAEFWVVECSGEGCEFKDPNRFTEFVDFIIRETRVESRIPGNLKIMNPAGFGLNKTLMSSLLEASSIYSTAASGL